ncbi:MAG: hypothetical protein KJ578_07610 [Bacteroidetes bacterium]|nr:hypothetical protein [Bacteroidota bacterium]MBU1581078.1 hypothetical protein [Bacteroidota bacterium]MBU2557629.1 hypothetical protein [Bacteroidota bacterium]
MKTRIISFLSLVLLGLYLISASGCNKKDDDESPTTCSGPAQVSVAGAITGSYCLQEVTNFKYDDHIEINIVLSNGGDESVMLFASVGYAGEGLNPGPGTYQCGGENPGYVQLGYHGTNQEFYNSVSGTLTITSVSQSSLKGSFSVTSKGYYDEETATVTGTINY